jgi:hypothetical protein
MRIFMY